MSFEQSDYPQRIDLAHKALLEKTVLDEIPANERVDWVLSGNGEIMNRIINEDSELGMRVRDLAYSNPEEAAKLVLDILNNNGVSHAA